MDTFTISMLAVLFALNEEEVRGEARVNVLPDDGVTAPKHVGAVLMYILILF